ncbi:succinylglutamate desuccinylase [Aquitalea sp. FJL05]|uniref:succinylglutamate desuccinylase n=1 Tax=Aquitalea TaxID=407217 RepID=UPI000F598FE1|nr:MULTISPECIES: succinylglutamate desuccinylase [Aquitalea]RQO73063.1 succinylglutamate desuccinylase [Aquitalea sp. FJL05]
MTTSHSRFLQHVLQPAALAETRWTLAHGVTAHWHDDSAVELRPATPAASCSYILLSCGIHGNETAPVEVVDGILADIDSGQLRLHHPLLVLFGNPQAMRCGERYLDYDLNRLFNGAHQQHADLYEAERAALLEQRASRFFAQAGPHKPKLHYDLHTAIRGSVYEKFAIYPFLQQRTHRRSQLAWLKHCGIEAVLLHSKPANTFSYYTSQQHQADAFTLELGKARPFGENDLGRFAGIDHALRQLLDDSTPALPDYRDGDYPLFRAKYDLIKHSEAFRLHLAASVENFTVLPDGFLIAEDGTQRYIASGGEERILFPNPTVKPGLRAGIVVEPATLTA